MKEELNAKQVIVVRKDIISKISKGKLVGQCCHASMGALLSMMNKEEFKKLDNYGKKTFEYSLSFTEDSFLDYFLNKKFTKVVVSTPNNETLLELYNKIKNSNKYIPIVLITESTMDNENTCIGIGPYWSSEIDKFTKDLPLL